MPGGGSKPGERRGGRQRGTPNKTLTEQAQALAAKVAKAEARANAKLVALAHAIQATVAESRGLPGASARERFKELVLNALVAEKLALKEIAHEPENTSIAEPAAEPAAAPDDADGVLVDWVPATGHKTGGRTKNTPNSSGQSRPFAPAPAQTRHGARSRLSRPAPHRHRRPRWI
jgi:hypothetical protein